MHHPQICIGALLVLLFCFKDLAALPQYQRPNANASLVVNEPPNADILEARSLNVSDSIPKLRSNLEDKPQGDNDSVLPSNRILPASVAKQQADDAAPGGSLGPQAPTVSSDVGERAAFKVEEAPPSNVSLPEPGSTMAVAARVGLEESLSNSSSLQQRSLYPNASEAGEIASRIGNASVIEARSLGADSEPAVRSSNNYAVFNAPPASPFVPSFLKSFGLRRKRDQTAGNLEQLASELSASMGSEQLSEAQQQQIAERLLLIANLDGALSNGNVNSEMESLLKQQPDISASYLELLPVGTYDN